MSAEVVSAGMGKLDEISTDSIVSEVTSALIAQALAKIDMNKIVTEAVQK